MTAAEIPDPPLARRLFSDARAAPLWLLPRLLLGALWLTAGLEKLFNADGVWVGRQAGVAVTGYVTQALERDAANMVPHIMAWYASFLHGAVLAYPVLFSVLVTAGEIFVGAALVLGLFTGIAAFFGGVMNVAFMFAGSVGVVSANPLLFILATWMVLAWKVAGLWGLDRWVLPALGVPGIPGWLLRAPVTSESGKMKHPDRVS